MMFHAMKLHVLRAVSFSVYLIGITRCQKCFNKEKAKEIPKGLKTVPVVLVLAAVNTDVRLPCHYCNERTGISGRQWRRRSLHGREKRVPLDMHDDPSRNRIFVTEDHSLVIRKVQPKDGAYYFCYDVQDKRTEAKMDILLDIEHRTTLEPPVLRLPANIDIEVFKWLRPCSKIRRITSVSKYRCYAEWGPWSQCDACDKIGERRRVGECRLQKFAKAKMETPDGRVVEADFPIVGVGCHSFLLDDVPQAKKILSQIPNLVLIEKCEVSCASFVTKPSRMKAFQRYSFLHKMKVKMMKKLNQVSPVVKSETKRGQEGACLTLFCPGATLDTRVKWKFKERPLNAEKVRERSRGRISIDATDALHIDDLRVTDAGEYTCTLYDVEIGIIRLTVTSRHAIFDPTTNFGILTLTLLFSFVLWAVLTTVRWKNFKMQRQVQRGRGSGLSEESEGLLTPATSDV